MCSFIPRFCKKKHGGGIDLDALSTLVLPAAAGLARLVIRGIRHAIAPITCWSSKNPMGHGVSYGTG